MNIRDAIFKAADHIEQNPQLFNFEVFQVPSDCGTPACALGWIALFSGIALERAFGGKPGVGWNCQRVLGCDDMEFYSRMACIHGHRGWKNAKDCPSTLRAYADKYHPAEVSKVIVPEAGSWDLIPWQPKQVRTQDDASLAAMRAQTR